MNILIPKNVFLRVEDKFVPGFIDSDQAVATSPTLLYRKLFAECYATGKCRLPQKYLAGQCKFSVRTLQYAQTRLVELGYIHVEHTPGECSSYILLLSDRVKKLLVDYDLLDRSEWYPRPAKTPPQNLQGRYAKAAEPSYKEDKKEKSAPLSPHAPASCKSAPSARKPFPSTTPVPNPQAGGWGDSFSKGKKPGKASGFQTANTLFERFFAAYPRKDAKEPARAVWHQLWRRGALPALDRLLAALDRFRASTGWIKEHGRFVPYLVNWLRGRRWADVTDAPGASSPGVQSAPSSDASVSAAVGTAENPRHAQAVRRCLQRLEEQHGTDPALESARPVFEKFLSCFADGGKRGPAWGLWSLLYQLGKAPTADDASGREGEGAFAFLQTWQRSTHATA